MTRPRVWLPSLLGLALLLGHGEVEARKVITKPVPNRPVVQPKPPPPPPGWEQAQEIGNSGYVPPGPDEGVSASSTPTKLVEATATVWAQAGSRSWTGCSANANEAGNQLSGTSEEVNNYRENHHWAVQARECPNAPEVLAMAARTELLRRFDLPDGLDETSELGEIEAGVAESRDRALAWLDDAEAELGRRRDTRSLGLDYWRGRALLSTGDLVGARAALERALREASVEGWRLRRLLALTELYDGNLDAALELAKRAWIDAPNNDRMLSYLVLGLVLDRAGDQAGARRRMKVVLDRDDAALRNIESALPIHERLYLRAYARTVRNDASGALRLWAAYLARPEPEAPERHLAERHQTALRPLPSNLGGPAHADEGRAANELRKP